ncbi:hypothetical protein [Spirillospora sp. NPDC047279]|uniref:hypothetical protein n=1 Tax=Spirillospora sp. NPDC047279 TaxID=3155478 RepID=UPI003410C88D
MLDEHEAGLIAALLEDLAARHGEDPSALQATRAAAMLRERITRTTLRGALSASRSRRLASLADLRAGRGDRRTAAPDRAGSTDDRRAATSDRAASRPPGGGRFSSDGAARGVENARSFLRQAQKTADRAQRRAHDAREFTRSLSDRP